MPITLTNLMNNTASVTIHYEEYSFDVVYYPKKFTLKVISGIRTGGEDALIETFCKLIKSWDIYEDQAQRIMTPITPARLQEFPLDLLNLIVDTVVKEIRPEAKAPQTT